VRDVALLAILAGLSLLALRRAWLGAVGLALLGAMHPQSYASGWMAAFPAYKVLFAVTCISLSFECWRARRWPKLFPDWRLGVLALLYADFALTTWFAVLPDTARQRFIEVAALVPPLLLTLWLIDTREKLHYVVVATAAGIALVALKGGYWALMTGFSDRVYGPPESQIGGNNEFAVALAMTIPLLVLWRRQSADRALRWVLAGAIVLCYVAALTSWSRGGLVTLSAMSAVLVWNSRHKPLAAGLLALGVALAVVNLPEQWQARMQSIPEYGQDESFQGRQEAWRQGLAYLREHPWTGSGFEGWRAVNASFGTAAEYSARDWHSSYVEAAVEHGVPGFVLWCALLAGTLCSLVLMCRRGKAVGDPWQVDHGAMLAASLVAFAAGGLTLGITYWELYFQLIAYAYIAIRLSRVGRAESRGRAVAGPSDFFTLRVRRSPSASVSALKSVR